MASESWSGSSDRVTELHRPRPTAPVSRLPHETQTPDLVQHRLRLIDVKLL